MTDYMQFRGKCKELSEALVANDPTLRLVRGHYVCPIWGRQAHWWTERLDGSVVDPSARQFPSNGSGVYEPFDGAVECANCHKEMQEADVQYSDGRYAFCSYLCYGQFVGVA